MMKTSLLWLFTRGGVRVSVGALVAPFVLVPLFCHAEEAIPLVREGKATGVIVVAEQVNPLVEEAARVFAKTVESSTGAAIPIISEREASGLGREVTRLYLGACQENAALGLDPNTLPPETYKRVARGNTIHLVGSERVASRVNEEGRPLGWVSRPTLWALNRILEDQLQVRWLWPGELGTVIPKHSSLVVKPGEVEYQPKLLLRSLRIAATRSLALDREQDERLRGEASLWAENHGVGKRGNIRFGHAFGDWWMKYSALHPDYFADLGNKKQPYLKPSSVKLRLSNPKVIEQIAEEYIAAGKPQYYNVCPNDGSGFDIHPDTLAWDIPRNQSKKAIITARGELTARYVMFWNLLYKRLVEINPDVILTTYAYSSYRNPPPPERPLTARAILGIVPDYDSYDLWRGWAKHAEGLFLRPNWWHFGADAPYLPLKETYDYIRFASDNGMMGIDMDSVLGYWGTQSPAYYMVARQMNRPELTLEQILDEYASGFGKGAPKIREYIDYWQKLTSDYDYTKRETDPNNKYHALLKENKVPRSLLSGAKYVLPYLYTDEVIAPSERLLDEAETLIGTEDKVALARVVFLRKGLVSLRATREQIARGDRLKAKQTEQLVKDFREGSEKLDRIRSELTRDHVLWDGATARHENAYKVLIRPENVGLHNINLDGL